ncbi:PAS domain S-box protein [candidate division KSB1 bacterium]
MSKPSYEELKQRIKEIEKVEKKHKQAKEALQQRVELIELVTIISTTFISLTPDETDEEILNDLELIGKFSDVDRSYIFLFSKDRKKMDNTHEWCAEGIESKISKLKKLSVNEFPWLIKKIKNLETIHITSISDIPSYAGAEKKFFKSQAAKSFIIIPMVYGNSLVGFLGFDTVRSEKTWKEEDIALLKIVSNIFINALERKWAEENLRRNEEELKKHRDHLEEMVKDRTAKLTETNKQLKLEIRERKKVEKKLSEREKSYRLLAENVTDVIFTTDMKLKFTYISSSAKDMLGYSVEEAITKTVEDILNPDSLKIATETFKEALTAEKKEKRDSLGSRTLELELNRKDSTTVWCEVKMSFIRDKDNNPVGILGVARDIADRKKAEEALKEITYEQSVLLSIVPAMIFWIDKKGNFIRVNKAFAEALHKSPDDICSRSLFELYPEDMARSYHNDNIEVIKSGISKRHIEEPVETHEGVMWVSTDKIPYTDETGNIIGIIGFSVDITEHKMSDKALKESEKKYRELTDLLPQTIFEIDLEGNFTFANRHGFKSSGYTQKDIDKGLNALQLFIPEDRDRVKQNIQKILSGEKLGSNEYTALRKDGSTYPVIIYSAPIIHKDKPVGLRGIVVDITDRKKAENELRKSNTAIETFLNAVFTADFEGKVTYANPAAADMWRYNSTEDMIGTHVLDYWAKKSQKKAKKVINILSKEGSYTGEGLIGKRKDGTEFIVEIKSSIIKDESGKPVGMVSSFSDISERKKMEEDLKERIKELNGLYGLGKLRERIEDLEELFYRFIEDIVPASMKFPNKTFVMIELDEKKYCSNVKYEHDDVISLSVPIIVKKEQRGCLTIGYTKKLASIDEFEQKLINGYAERLGKIIEIKETDEELRMSEKRFRDMTNLLPQTVFEIDLQGNLTFVNLNAFDSFGYNKDDFSRSLNYIQMLIPEDRDKAKKNIKRILGGEKLGSNEYTALTKNGSTFPVIIYSSAIIHKGEPVGVRGIVIDVSERKKTEET